MAVKYEITPDLYVLKSVINNGVLISDTKVVLFDCDGELCFNELKKSGITDVEIIFCTQHRRPNTAGLYDFIKHGSKIAAPFNEQHLFTDVETYWNDVKNRWHIYHHQPSTQILQKSVPVTYKMKENDIIKWEGYSILALDTPGATCGSVSYIVDVNDKKICFCGDLIYDEGMIWELYSLQKGTPDVCRDYHGFMGNAGKLISSLKKLIAYKPDILVPSHGNIIKDPDKAVGKLIKNLEAIYDNYFDISSMNYYYKDFPVIKKQGRRQMKEAKTCDLPEFIYNIYGTSFVVISDSGSAFIVDCGESAVLEALQNWIDRGVIKNIDFCWVTHYHDDHVDHIKALTEKFDCPVFTDRITAEILEYPLRFFLPCISPNELCVSRKTFDAETWYWNEFKLTAYHFPGQSYYHSGLLLEGHAKKIFFAGDSASPRGIDDYCCGNRNFIGKGKGFDKCMTILRKCAPDHIINQHQQKAFVFDNTQLDYITQVLDQRHELISEALPWQDPNFGIDEWWVRTYPYEQYATSGRKVIVEVQFTNHGDQAVLAAVLPVLQEGFTWDRAESTWEVVIPANTSGTTLCETDDPDVSAKIVIYITENIQKGKYIIPFKITWGDMNLGQIRHAVVNVVNDAQRY